MWLYTKHVAFPVSQHTNTEHSAHKYKCIFIYTLSSTKLSHSHDQLGCFSKACLCKGSWIVKVSAYFTFMKSWTQPDCWCDYTKKQAGKHSDILIWKSLSTSLSFSIYLHLLFRTFSHSLKLQRFVSSSSNFCPFALNAVCVWVAQASTVCI